MFNSFPTDLTEKQHINREAKEARGTKMANTCRDSFKSDEDKRENSDERMQREWEKGNAGRTAGAISSSADVKEEEHW